MLHSYFRINLPTATKLTLAIILYAFALPASAQEKLPYQNPGLPIEQRVDDLLARMTTKEKFWQMFMIPGGLSDGKERYRDGIFGFQVAAKGTAADAAGQLLEYGPSGSAEQVAILINEIQRYFVEETRLGIPIIPFDEALHGLVRDGATAFPQADGTYYRPENYDRQYHGPVSLRNAMARSYNIPAIRVMSQVGVADALRLSGLDPAGIFLGKVAGIAVHLLALQVVLIAGVTLFYGTAPHGAPLLVATCLAATVGLASVGSLYGILSAGMRVRDTLLPLLVLPVVAPVLISATQAFAAAYAQTPGSGWRWLGLLTVFALLYLVIGILAFENLLEEP